MGERRQVGQEVCDRAAGESQRGVRRVRISEAVRTQDIEANEHLDMRHRSELAGLDAPQDFLGGAIEDVVVVFNQVAAGLLGALSQSLKLVEGRGRRLLNDHMGAGVEGVHRQPKVGGRGSRDMDDIGPDLLQHGQVAGEPRRDAIPLGDSLCRGGRKVADGRQLNAWQGLQAGEVLAGDLPRSNERRLQEPASRIRR